MSLLSNFQLIPTNGFVSTSGAVSNFSKYVVLCVCLADPASSDLDISSSDLDIGVESGHEAENHTVDAQDIVCNAT